MQTTILIVGMGILAVIAYGDVRTRRIPNVLSLAIAILGLLRIILGHDTAAMATLLRRRLQSSPLHFCSFGTAELAAVTPNWLPLRRCLSATTTCLVFFFS